MLNEQQVNQYLARLGYGGGRDASVDTLSALHLAHLYRVPFENLDIALGITISLSDQAIFHKVIEQRRGGFCYELNYAFYLLLTSLAFDVQLLSARVNEQQKLGPPFDHLLLLVTVNGQPYAVDVGFGDSFTEPLLLAGGPVLQHGSHYKIDKQGDGYGMFRKLPGQQWQCQYLFSTKSRTIGDFAPMCHYQQTSPESHFTQKSVCSLATGQGRKTIGNGRFIVTEQGQRTEVAIVNEKVYRQLLQQHFNMSLPGDIVLDDLLARQGE